MADGIDRNKALIENVQDVTAGMKKKKNAGKTGNTKPIKDSSGTPHVEYNNYSSSTKTNSNGNALQTSANTGWSKPRMKSDNSEGYQLVPKRKNRDKDHGSARHPESGISLSGTSVQKNISEIPDSLEVVNSKRRIPSGVKNTKKSMESDSARNQDDSASTLRQDGSSFHNRNSSTVNNQRQNRELSTHSHEDAAQFRRVQKYDSYRNEGRGDKSRMQRGDGRNQIEMTAESKNNSVNNSKSSAVEPQEEELTEEFLLTLEENKIQLMKKRNLRFPKAKYFCDLCDFHLTSKIDCDKHMKEYRHCRKKKLLEEDTILRSLPEPTEHQFAALTEAVDKVYEEHGISEGERKQRADIVLRLERKLKETIPDVVIFMYGSSLTGFGLKTSDINVNLTSADQDKKLTILLRESYLSLKDRTDTGFSNVRSDFTAKVPALLMMDDLTGLTVNVTIHCYSAHCSSELLSIYSDFDIRVRKLAVAFRYWAHLCELDRKCDGFIPPQALNLMVIYFLQVINPQLVPIIEPPKVTGDEIGDYRKDSPTFEKRRAKVMEVSMKCRNTMSVGELWFKLLWFYCLEFDTPNVVVCIRKNQAVPRNSKPWNSKRLAVEDPYILKKNVTGMINNSRINEYWEDSFRRALRYFGFPRDTEGKSDISVETLLKMTCKKETSEEQEMDSSSLVLESKSFASSKVVTPDKGNQTQKQNSSRPQILKNEFKNSSHSESDDIKDSNSDDSDFDDVTDQQLSFDNYAIQNKSSKIQTSSASLKKSLSVSHPGGPSVSATLKDNQSLKLTNSDSGISVALSHTTDKSYVSQRIDRSDTSLCENISHSSVSKFLGPVKQEMSVCKSNEHIDAQYGNDKSDCAYSSNKSVIESGISTGADQDDQRSTQFNSPLEEVIKTTRDIELLEEQKDIISLLAQDGCHYEFSKEFVTDGKSPVLVCAYCEKEGHLKNACPEDKLPDVLPLPPLTPLHVKHLSETLNRVPSIVGLSPLSLAERANFLKALEESIQVQFKDAELALFGSSCNGFGFEHSDMDICLTFSQRKKIDTPWLIESLARKMKQNRDLVNVQAIPTAKVPIVKFTVKRTGLEGDISLYNILAQHNTKLLLCYSQIDPRVRVLGYTIKNFAKVCDIGDASRGSLSSYAYILMMIYYLQQVVPPVVPVLQELYRDKEKPQLMVEGCDAWFMDDLTQLNNLWPEKGKNKMSLAELWLGFLRFYVEEFNYKELVVSIRQREPLTRFEKLWNGENIAIEDPFDQKHNLGSALSRKMNNFIFRTFINGRMLYGSPVDDNLKMFQSYPNPYKYFFDPELLSESRPPNARGCHNCGKIGHIVRNCPAGRKDKEEQKRPNHNQKQSQQENRQPQQQRKEQLPPQQGQSPSAHQQQQRHLPASLQENHQQKKEKPVSSAQHQQQMHPPSSQQERQLQNKEQPVPSVQHPLSSQQERQQQQGRHPPSSQQERQQQKKEQPVPSTQHHPSSQQERQQQKMEQPVPSTQHLSSSQQERQQQQGRHHPSSQQEKQQQQNQRCQPQRLSEHSQHTHEQSQHIRPQHQYQSQLSYPQRHHQRPLLHQQHSLPLQFPQPQQQNHPPEQQQQRQPLLHQKNMQPFQSQQQGQPSQQLHPQQQQEHKEPPYHQQRRQSQEANPLLHSSYTLQNQPHQQHIRSSSQPEEQHRQSPQSQHQQGQFFHPQPMMRQPQQQDRRQSPQQQEIQPFHPQQQWQPSQPQLQNHPNPLQQSQLQQQQEHKEPPYHQQRRQSQEANPLLHSSYTLQNQPHQQHIRSSSQPEEQHRQSPQSQHQQGQFFHPQPMMRQPQQQDRRQSPQQQEIQPFHPQQQLQPSQPQLQNHPNPLQQSQLQQHQLHCSQQPIEREFYDRQERDQWQNSQAGNMNSNSSVSPGPRLQYSPDQNQSIPGAMQPMTGNLHTRVFHNTNYRPPYHFLQQHQQLPRNYMSNYPLAATLGSLPPPLMSFPPRSNFTNFRPPLLNHPSVTEYPQAPQNYGSGYSYGNQQFAPSAQYSGQGSGDSNSVRGQFMSPAVQNLFDNALMNASTDQYQTQK